MSKSWKLIKDSIDKSTNTHNSSKLYIDSNLTVYKSIIIN